MDYESQRQTALSALDTKYSPQINAAISTVQSDQATLDTLNAAYANDMSQVNAYYDALEQQAQINALIDTPPAVISELGVTNGDN